MTRPRPTRIGFPETNPAIGPKPLRESGFLLPSGRTGPATGRPRRLPRANEVAALAGQRQDLRLRPDVPELLHPVAAGADPNLSSSSGGPTGPSPRPPRGGRS